MKIDITYYIDSLCTVGCLETCVSGFLGRNGLETFYNYNPNIVLLKNIPGFNRYLPALRFTCNTTITHVSIAATRASGVTSGAIELEVQRVVQRVHRILLQQATPSDNPGVYELALSQPLPVQVNDVVSIFESLSSPLNLYNMDGGMSMKSIYISLTGSFSVPGDDDQPLMSIETGNTLLIEISSIVQSSIVLNCVPQDIFLICSY